MLCTDCNVSAKYVFNRIMSGKLEKHRQSNSVLGWSVWVGVVTAIWAVAFIFGEIVPSKSDCSVHCLQ